MDYVTIEIVDADLKVVQTATLNAKLANDIIEDLSLRLFVEGFKARVATKAPRTNR